MTILVISLLAIGSGVGFGFVAPSLLKQDADKAPAEPLQETDAGPPSLRLEPISPLTTNLAEPPNTWIRLEAALVIQEQLGPDADVLKKQVSADLLGYLRTVTLDQIQGPSGYQHLREDLNDRVRIRSAGKISSVVITSLILE